jgi:hypothetical protein
MTAALQRLLCVLLVSAAIEPVSQAQACAIERASLGPSLLIDMVFTGHSMPAKLQAMAMTEVKFIWARYGVDVRAVGVDDVARDRAIRLTVQSEDDADRHVSREALGSIRFLDGEPQPVIALYLNAIAALVSTTTALGLREPEWPPALHDVIVGRVVGRALAHEIGHFLLRSRDHSRTGLMRALQRTTDLVSEDRGRFLLRATDAARLVPAAATAFEFRPPSAPSARSSAP